MSLGIEYTGAHLVGDGLTAPDIWQLLHSNAREWRNVPRNSDRHNLREILDTSDRSALESLRPFPAAQWEHLCYGAGWTTYGAVALSWCRDARFDKVTAGWKQSGHALCIDEVSLRAAGMINPAFLPAGDKLSTLVDSLPGDIFALALTLAARHRMIEIDFTSDVLKKAPGELAPFILLCIEESGREDEFSELLRVWKIPEK